MGGLVNGWVGGCMSFCLVDRSLDRWLNNSIYQSRNFSDYTVWHDLQLYLMAGGRLGGWLGGWVVGWLDV